MAAMLLPIQIWKISLLFTFATISSSFLFQLKNEISNQFLLVYNFIYALLSIAVWGKRNAWWLGREFGCNNCKQNKRWWARAHSSWRLLMEGKKWGIYFLWSFVWCLLLKILHPEPYMRLITQITAAHICYLIADANFESYSDTARLCLIGADHWKHPRTYVSPEAIQVLSNFVRLLHVLLVIYLW